MSTEQTEDVKVRIVYNFISNSDSIGELHVFFHESRIPVEGEKIYLENEFTEGIFLPKGRYRHKIEGQLKILRDNLRIKYWVSSKIYSDNPKVIMIDLHEYQVPK